MAYGSNPENSVMRVTGLNKATDVTLKRGVIGSLKLYRLLDDLGDGKKARPLPTVWIHLQNEDHTAIVQT